MDTYIPISNGYRRDWRNLLAMTMLESYPKIYTVVYKFRTYNIFHRGAVLYPVDPK